MDHYYSEKQTSELRLNRFKAVLRGEEFEFIGSSGVFGVKKVDRGTEVLINNCIIEEEWDILDLGCGIGVVGISLKKLFPKCNMTLTDINKRAIKISKMNAKSNKVDVEFFQGNIYEPLKNKKFNTILCNPPQSAGKDICLKIIDDSLDYLKPKGLLQLVVRHQKGGKSLEEHMKKVFGNVKDIAKKSGYRVYVSER